ncbi:hypothetical protein J6590_079952 [Homalodisca vitripennis]|nr:hypothetical protein J6590_079952 [Homalodisca vitripennis]
MDTTRQDHKDHEAVTDENTTKPAHEAVRLRKLTTTRASRAVSQCHKVPRLATLPWATR